MATGGPARQQSATASTHTQQLATLEAVRVLAVGVRGRPPFPLTPEALAAAEALLPPPPAGPGAGAGAGKRRAAAATAPAVVDQHQQHGARLVLQWAVGVLVAPHGGAAAASAASTPPPALREARVWRVCERALTPTAAPSSSRGAGAGSQQQLLATTLPQASALGMFQAAATAVFAEGAPAEAGEAAVRAVAALTGLPYPPLESWTLASIHTVGLPQVPADRALELVATEVVDRLHARPDAPGGAALGALALQYLTLVQTQQANQRKAFPTLVQRLLRPLLALQRRFQAQPYTKAPGSLALRRAIDAAVGEILFHREHLDGLRAVLLAQRPQDGGVGGEEAGAGGRSRKRPRKGKEKEKKGEGEGEAGGQQPPQPPQEGSGADKWAAYQGQLLQAMEGWVNRDGAGAAAAAAAGSEWPPETRALVLSLPHLYRSFVRRLGAAAAGQQQAKAAAGAAAGGAQAGADTPASLSSGAAAAAAVGQKRRELEAAAAAASASAYAARPAFAMALRLWALLWRPGGQGDEEARVARLAAARGVLEAVLSLGVYHYDSDQSAGGQFRSVERVFLQLLDFAAASTPSARIMEGEVLCLAALLRIDHRVATDCLPRLLGLLAARYHAAAASASDGQKNEDEQQQQRAAALRRACVATVSEAADTYARLRQVGALLQALLALEAQEALEAAATAARALVMDAAVGAALGRAIRDCPPPQFVPLWDALAGGGEGEEREEGEPAAVTRRIGAGGVRYRLLSLLLANVRVSALNAGPLGARAAGIMARLEAIALAKVEEASAALGEKGKKGKKKQQQQQEAEEQEAAVVVGTCLELYARLLELQVTCDYWSGGASSSSSSSTSSPSPLLQRLLPHGELSAACKPALDHLAVARLRQLRQEKGVRGVAQADAEAEAAQEAEQRELAAFLFSSSSSDGGPHPLDLSTLGASLPLWAPHATQAHLDAFWDALLHASFEAGTSTGGVVEGDAPPARRLLADAGFYEIGALAARCLPCALRLQLRALLRSPPGDGQEEAVLAALEAAAPEEVAAAAAALLEQQQQSASTPAASAKKGKAKAARKSTTKGASAPAASSAPNPLAAALLRALHDSSGNGDTMGEEETTAAVARAVHAARLLNSLPRGYLPPAHAPLRFAAAVLLDAAAVAVHQQTPTPGGGAGAFAPLRSALAASALQALRTRSAAIPALVAGRPALLRWLVGRALHGGEVGVDLLGAFLRQLLAAEGTDKEATASAVSALVDALAAAEGGTLVADVGGAGEDDDAAAAHALAVVAELVVPFLTTPATPATDAALAPLLALVEGTLALHLARRLRGPLPPGLRPAVLRLHALLLELLGPRALFTNDNDAAAAAGRLLRQLLPTDALGLLLPPSSSSLSALSASAAAGGAAADTETMAFLAAYLRWAPRDALGAEAEAEAPVLEAMVELVLRPGDSAGEEPAAAATALAAALGRAGPAAQRRALERLEGAVARVGASLAASASAVGAAGGDAAGVVVVVVREAAVLARACRLAALLVEQGGVGGGPGAAAVAAVAQPVLSHVVRALGALEAAVLAAPSSVGLGAGQGVVGRAVVEGLDLLRLYTRKRWLFFSSSLSSGPSVEVASPVAVADADVDAQEAEAAAAAATDEEGSSAEAMDVVDGEEEEDEPTTPAAVDDTVEQEADPASPAPSTPTAGHDRARGGRGGMRVEDIGRLLAPLAALPAVLAAAASGADRHHHQPRPLPPASSAAEAGDGRGQTAEEAAFGAACSLLSALLKHHPRLLYQGAPPAVQAARGLFRALLLHRHGQDRLGPVAAKAWARLMEHMAGHSAALRKHLMLLLADFLSVSPQLPAELKACLQPAAFALIDALTPFEIQHMHAALLDAAGQALLKKLHGDYQQRYKYRGRV